MPESSVHVWMADLDRASDEFPGLPDCLSAGEHERAMRFRFEVHRTRFIAGRGLLRMILSRYLATAPDKLFFEYSTFGKPHLDKPGFHFNVAHSDDRFCLAIANGPVGIDLEKAAQESGEAARAADLDRMAEMVFSDAENTEWSSVSHERRASSFLALWTRKEALLKGIGLGIANHVKDVSVFFENNSPVIVPPALSSDPWNVTTFSEPSQIWSIATAFTPAELLRLSFKPSEFSTSPAELPI